MKPIKLTIEGVNSFIEPQTLDFEAVGRTNLFCISGKTGAGKTTIFDSIMLALYGKSGKGNLADVVNLSRTSARVEFEFAAKGERYTVERTIKTRKEKNSDGEALDKRTASCDCTLYKNGEVLKKGEEATEFIRDLIGLEAGEFKNVYLLEQGEYAEFLKKTPTKQTEAVGKIFDLMRFGDVYSAANEKMRDFEQRARGKQQTVLDLSHKYGLIDQPLYDEYVKDGVSVKTAADLRDELNDRLTAEHKELSALKAKTTTLTKDAEGMRAELETLEKARELYISVTEKQKQVQNLMLSLDEAKRKARIAVEQKEAFDKTRDTSAAAKLTALREKLDTLNTLSALDREYEAAVKDVAAKKTAEADKREKSERAAQTTKQKEQAKTNAQIEFINKLAEFVSYTDRLKEKSQRLIAAIDGVNAPTGKPAAVADAIHELNDELREYKSLSADLSAAEKKRGELAGCKAAVLQKIEKYEGELKEITARLEAAEKTEKETAAALAAAQLNSHAAAVRAELHDGDKCPVCGGVYGGCCDTGDTDVAERKSEHDGAVKVLEDISKQKTECEKHIDGAKTEYTHYDGAFAECEAKIAELKEQSAATRVDPEVYAALIELLTSAKKLGEEAAAKESEFSKFVPEVTRLNAELEAAANAVKEAESKAEDYKARLGDSCGKTAERVAAVKGEISALEQKEREFAEQSKKLENELNGANGAVSAVERSLEAARADCPVDMPPFDEEKYSNARDRAESVNKQINENEKTIAVKQTQLTSLESDHAAFASAVAEYATVGDTISIYKKIADMTKGKAMLNYVATEYIVEFTAIASEILGELSSGKYTMSYDKTNGFIVSDYLNGGKSRKTDTLSGGELFLASLSVAIAIARTVGNGNNAFFFLDEGFGTLDDELIDTVYGALESLSKDCLVGVITHANALIDRMPSCVEVLEATDTAGSKINC
ncbi:MAG: SMC family ATPase [Clostridiales bacterium]|nr:SMC family ATPase [Clostridiales bacterium]